MIIIAHGYETRSFVHTCLRRRSDQALLKLGFRLDIDVANEDFRVIQFTPPGSEVSIIFGKGITSAKPGSIDPLVLAVYDIDAAPDKLIAHGVDVKEVFHYAGGPFNNVVENPRVGGRDPQGRSYYSFASFEDPDGNGWLLQEIQTRLPGREWDLTRPQVMDVATLAGLLQETAEHHDHFEKMHAEHHWWNSRLETLHRTYVNGPENGFDGITGKTKLKEVIAFVSNCDDRTSENVIQNLLKIWHGNNEKKQSDLASGLAAENIDNPAEYTIGIINNI